MIGYAGRHPADEVQVYPEVRWGLRLEKAPQSADVSVTLAGMTYYAGVETARSLGRRWVLSVTW